MRDYEFLNWSEGLSNVRVLDVDANSFWIWQEAARLFLNFQAAEKGNDHYCGMMFTFFDVLSFNVLMRDNEFLNWREDQRKITIKIEFLNWQSQAARSGAKPTITIEQTTPAGQESVLSIFRSKSIPWQRVEPTEANGIRNFIFRSKSVPFLHTELIERLHSLLDRFSA